VLDNDTPGDHPMDENTFEIIVAPVYANDYGVFNDYIYYRREVMGVVDIIFYQVCDTKGLCEQATVTVTVSK